MEKLTKGQSLGKGEKKKGHGFSLQSGGEDTGGAWGNRGRGTL